MTSFQDFRGIAFFATPHRGARLARLAKDIFPGALVSKAISDLEAGGSSVEKLHQHYKNWAEQNPSVLHFAYYETKTVSGAKVVDTASADPGLPSTSPIGLDFNHIDICKFKSTKDERYLQICQFLEDSLAVSPNRERVKRDFSSENDNIANGGRVSKNNWMKTAFTGVATFLFIAIVATTALKIYYAEPKSDLAFAQIRGARATSYDGKNSKPAFEENSDCRIVDPVLGGFIQNRKVFDICNDSKIRLGTGSSFSEYALDVTVINKSNDSILLSNVKLVIDFAEQINFGAGGDGAELVKTISDVTVKHSGEIKALAIESNCGSDEQEVLKSFKFDRFDVNQSGDCSFQLQFEAGEFITSSEHLSNCKREAMVNKKFEAEECDHIANISAFRLLEKFNLVGEFESPIEVRAGRPARFKMNIDGYVAFPNQMSGFLEVNNGEYRSNRLFLSRIDSAARWNLDFSRVGTK